MKVFDKQYIFKIKYVGTTNSVLKRERIKKHFMEKRKVQGQSNFMSVIVIIKMSRPI
jgi:hypothetical protein